MSRCPRNYMNSDSQDESPDPIQCHLLGIQVRKCYIDKKSAVMRRRYRPNPKWDTELFWTKVGALCLRINAPPDLFINAQFAEDKNRHGPFPNGLAGEAAMRRFVTWRNQHRTIAQSVNMTSQMKVNVELVAEEIARAITACAQCFPGEPIRGYQSAITNIPAWLRILTAPQDECVQRMWGAQGQSELQENPVLMNQCQAAGMPVSEVLAAQYDE